MDSPNRAKGLHNLNLSGLTEHTNKVLKVEYLPLKSVELVISFKLSTKAVAR